jgi:hypothetical protein
MMFAVLNWKKVVKRRYLRNTCLHPNMSDFTAPSLINWLIENLESAQGKAARGRVYTTSVISTNINQNVEVSECFQG